MFTKKKTTLFETPVKKDTTGSTTSGNAFVQQGLKKSAETLSGNNALKYITTGNVFVDQFGKMSTYKKPRSFDDIKADMDAATSANMLYAVLFTFFLRMITRVVQLFDGSKTSVVQKGAGLKHEGIMRMIYLHIYYPDIFWKNIEVWISIGSWKDILTMLEYDLSYNGWEKRILDWKKMGLLIAAGLENPNTSELVKKYLPHVVAKSKCITVRAQARTIIAKWLCSDEVLNLTYRKYRKLKVSGTAHEWQQLISQGRLSELDFDSVHGRALALLTSGKFIENNGLATRYESWIASKPVVKFTGYVYELGAKISANLKKYQEDTINKQFDGLVLKAQDNTKLDSDLIVVRDTSGSMTSKAQGTNQSSGDIAKGMGIFFSKFLKGFFADSWIEFANTARMHKYKTDTFVQRWREDPRGYVGSTNFQSVINLFVDLKRQGVPLQDFPKGILCISDGEFNPSELHASNVEAARLKLFQAGFGQEFADNFKIVLWNIPNSFYRDSSVKFETFGDVENVFYLSGYDGSILSFLLGTEKSTNTPQTALELFEASMNQEILSLIEV